MNDLMEKLFEEAREDVNSKKFKERCNAVTDAVMVRISRQEEIDFMFQISPRGPYPKPRFFLRRKLARIQADIRAYTQTFHTPKESFFFWAEIQRRGLTDIKQLIQQAKRPVYNIEEGGLDAEGV